MLSQSDNYGWIVPVLIVVGGVLYQIKEFFDNAKRRREEREHLERHGSDVRAPGQSADDDFDLEPAESYEDQRRREAAEAAKLHRQERDAEREARRQDSARQRQAQERHPRKPDAAPPQDASPPPTEVEKIRRLEQAMGLEPGTLSGGNAPTSARREPMPQQADRHASKPQPKRKSSSSSRATQAAAPLVGATLPIQATALTADQSRINMQNRKAKGAAALRAMLSKGGGRRAILLSEVLGPPKGMQ